MAAQPARPAACPAPATLTSRTARSPRRSHGSWQSPCGRPGGRLPLAKDLATVLGADTYTVLRALRGEGLLESHRGRALPWPETPQRGAVMAGINELIKFATQQGCRRDELIAMIGGSAVEGPAGHPPGAVRTGSGPCPAASPWRPAGQADCRPATPLGRAEVAGTWTSPGSAYGACGQPA
jgi:GntR family transcriptional regulator